VAKIITIILIATAAIAILMINLEKDCPTLKAIFLAIKTGKFINTKI
jgi:hypothetical protein